MPRVTLTHTCNHPACSGQAGDDLDVSDELAKYLLQRKGAVLTKPKPLRKQEKPAAEGDEETDEDNPGASGSEGADDGASTGGPQESARSRRRRRGRGANPAGDEPKANPDETHDAGDGDETHTDESDAAEAE